MNFKFNQKEQQNRAEKFHALHHADKTLVLPNAWDCASAKIFEETGFSAIATTSSGISWACGHQDGEHIPPELMINVIGRIARVVEIPVTADIEGGYYRKDLDEFSQFIGDTVQAGAVGINLEDGDSETGNLTDLNWQAQRIKSAKAAGKEKGVNLFVNARTDAMSLAKKDLKTKIKICIERAKAFKEAGADGIFIPFVSELETVIQLKKAIDLPLNILTSATLEVSELKKLKVNRISVGGKPMLATLNLLRKISTELKSENDWPSLYTDNPTYGDINGKFG